MNSIRFARSLFPVLYEDEHVVAVDKPAGLAVEPCGAAGGCDLLSVMGGLDGGRVFSAGDRLDRLASGVVLLARSEEAAAALAPRLAAETARNQYVVVVRGKVKSRYLKPAPAGRRRSPAPGRKRPPPSPAEETGLSLELLQRADKLAMVRLEMGNVGDMEVRRRLFSAGVPVLGDVRYSRRPDRRQSGRYFLHRAQVKVTHPFTGRTLVVRSLPPESFDAAVAGRRVIDEHLRTAAAARLSCLLDSATDAYRLLTGSHEGVPGLVVERYGPLVTLEVQEGRFQGGQDTLSAVARWYVRALGTASVLLRRSPRDRSAAGSRADELDLAPRVQLGRPCDEELAILENGLRFLVRPFEGLNLGLFLDHRDNRRRVRELAAGRRVLNLFAYTCGFSVAAAAGGAKEVTSVDLKKSRLEWGKLNLGLNGLPSDNHTFVCSEAFDYLARARRQGRTFDLMVVDPPTFARAKKPQRAFGVEKDVARLIAEALGVLAPGGLMLLSTNCRRVSKRWLCDQVAEAAGARRFSVVASPGLPVDFAVDRDHARTVIVRFA